MTKRVFVVAFVVDDDAYGTTPPPDNGDIVYLLASRLGEVGLSNFIVWSSVDDLISDHLGLGPINLEYLEDQS